MNGHPSNLSKFQLKLSNAVLSDLRTGTTTPATVRAALNDFQLTVKTSVTSAEKSLAQGRSADLLESAAGFLNTAARAQSDYNAVIYALARFDSDHK